MASVSQLQIGLPSSPASSTSSKKRKRALSQLPDLSIPHLVSDVSTISDIDGVESVPSSQTSNGLPMVDKVLSEEQRVGSASPRSIAANQFSHLQLHSETADGDVPRLPDTVLESFIPTRTDGGPPAKRLPPPEGIRSPRPRHRNSPFKLPVTSNQVVLSSSPSSITSTLSSTGSTSTALDFDFDFRSLTWQDSEITGHLMLDSDDDGTGINGLGFKPTTAMATARKQKRRAQILDWKARIAKEERERRAERRKFAAQEYQKIHEQAHGVKKAVRFAV